MYLYLKLRNLWAHLSLQALKVWPPNLPLTPWTKLQGLAAKQMAMNLLRAPTPFVRGKSSVGNSTPEIILYPHFHYLCNGSGCSPWNEVFSCINHISLRLAANLHSFVAILSFEIEHHLGYTYIVELKKSIGVVFFPYKWSPEI